MTKVYAVNCAALLDEAVLQRVLPLLDEARQARVRRLQNLQKRAQCAAAGWLLRHLFGDDGTVIYDGNGKPRLQDGPDTHINLSHTGDWVFCAVADAPVGIDAQKKVPCNGRLAERWFTDGERRWMAADPDGRFTRLWTQKEAYAKMTGDGMVKTVTGYDEVAHTAKEYRDLLTEGICVTVCVRGVAVFAPAIEIVRKPLW